MIGRGSHCGLSPPALSSAQVTVELELRHSSECGVVHGFEKKKKKKEHPFTGTELSTSGFRAAEQAGEQV